jgi:hypothetical protein
MGTGDLAEDRGQIFCAWFDGRKSEAAKQNAQ